MKKAILSMILAAAVILTLPVSSAFADSKGSKPAPVNCTVSMWVSVPGATTMHGQEMNVTGQQIEGALDCGNSPLTGGILITQGAEVKVDALGNFKGEIEGSFVTSNGIKGKIEGKITGGSLADPSTLAESVNGEWELAGKNGQGKGTFSIGLAFDPGYGTLVGGGVLSGKAKF